jgi:hypothetical protein
MAGAACRKDRRAYTPPHDELEGDSPNRNVAATRGETMDKTEASNTPDEFTWRDMLAGLIVAAASAVVGVWVFVSWLGSR